VIDAVGISATRGNVNTATRTLASTHGVLVGIGTIDHGVLECLQGPRPIRGFIVNAQKRMERRVLENTHWQEILLHLKRPQDHWNRSHNRAHSEERQQDHYRYAQTFHRVISHRPGKLGEVYSNIYSHLFRSAHDDQPRCVWKKVAMRRRASIAAGSL
jgi:hypothetical protein